MYPTDWLKALGALQCHVVILATVIEYAVPKMRKGTLSADELGTLYAEHGWLRSIRMSTLD